MRESAAAWGAVLHLVPSLAPVIEGYFKKEDGKRLIRAIKDPQQQEFYIQTWQQSSVFKTFFGDDSPCDDLDQDSAAQPTGTTAPPEEAVANHAEQFQTQSQPQQQAHELQHQQQHQQHQHHQQHHQQHYQQQQSVQNSIPMPPTHQPSSHSIAPAAPSPTGRTMTPGTSGGAIGGTGGTGLGLHPMQMQFGMPPGPSQSSIPPPSLPPRQAADPSPSSSSTLFPPLPQAPSSSLPYDPKLESLLHHSPQNGPPIQPLGGDMAVLGAPTVSLSDILARAAAQPYVPLLYYPMPPLFRALANSVFQVYQFLPGTGVTWLCARRNTQRLCSDELQSRPARWQHRHGPITGKRP